MVCRCKHPCDCTDEDSTEDSDSEKSISSSSSSDECEDPCLQNVREPECEDPSSSSSSDDDDDDCKRNRRHCHIGPQGSRWIGPQGSVGAQGDRGWQGKEGKQGHHGECGERGRRGHRGRDGMCQKGTQGAQGIAGTSSGGGGGVGPQGPAGDSGSPGRDGPQGQNGAQGVVGPSGAADGAQGAQGLGGPQGVAGFQGNFGTQGLDGPQGNRGFQGPSSAIPALPSRARIQIALAAGSTAGANSVFAPITSNNAWVDQGGSSQFVIVAPGTNPCTVRYTGSAASITVAIRFIAFCSLVTPASAPVWFQIFSGGTDNSNFVTASTGRYIPFKQNLGTSSSLYVLEAYATLLPNQLADCWCLIPISGGGTLSFQYCEFTVTQIS